MDLIIPIVTISVGLSSAIWDLRTRRIPNTITIPAIILGIVLQSIFYRLPGLFQSIEGLALGLGLLFIFFIIGAMGAGDVKLLAAIGALNGPVFVLFALLYGAIAGGIMAIILVGLKGQLNVVFGNVVLFFMNLMSRLRGAHLQQPLISVHSEIRMPYGAALFIGTVLAYVLR